MRRFQFLICQLTGFIIIGLLLTFGSCTTKAPALKVGIWRGLLERQDGHQVAFNFEVTDSAGHYALYIINADNHLKVDSVLIVGDSVFFKMPFFNSSFQIKQRDENHLSGIWIKDRGKNSSTMTFMATYGDSTRLHHYEAPKYNVSGSWAAGFTRPDGSISKAIGLFKQDGSKVTGTFLLPSGDYRYLQGVVSGDTLKLTRFDGSSAMRLTAIIANSNQIKNGRLYNVKSPACPWVAERKNYDTLPNAYKADKYLPGKVKIDFDFKNFISGKTIRLSDSQFKDEVVIIDILGSWCPNCMDEIPFMNKLYTKNKDKGLSILGVAFERTDDFEQSKKTLQPFFKKLNIQYPVLFSGISVQDKNLTQKAFPGLPITIRAYPTTIFIGKKGFVRVIQNGFNGPATGKYFEEDKKKITAIVNDLLAEK